MAKDDYLYNAYAERQKEANEINLAKLTFEKFKTAVELRTKALDVWVQQIQRGKEPYTPEQLLHFLEAGETAMPLKGP